MILIDLFTWKQIDNHINNKTHFVDKLRDGVCESWEVFDRKVKPTGPTKWRQHNYSLFFFFSFRIRKIFAEYYNIFEVSQSHASVQYFSCLLSEFGFLI